MKITISSLNLLVVVTLAFAGCTHDPSASNRAAPAARLIAIDLSAEEASSWGYQKSMTADLDGDRRPETITLASDVELLNGRPLWEDGHRWAVTVQDDSAVTLAYAAFVPRGFVETALLERSHDGTMELLVNERSPEQLMSVTISYSGPERVTATSASYYQIESWFPGSATPSS